MKIDWSYLGDTSQLETRYWYFNSSDGSRTGRLARIVDDGNPGGEDFSLIPRFEIDKPAALILKNVDQRYNGMYTFDLKLKSSRNILSSKVVVFIASKFCSKIKLLVFSKFAAIFSSVLGLHEHCLA